MWLHFQLVFFVSTSAILSAAQQYSGIFRRFLQADDIQDRHEFAPSNDTVSCTRVCVPGGVPRTCYYQFYMENYVTVSGACRNCTQTGQSCDIPQCVTADGFERAFLSINRRLPGPSIQVCQGDRIIVDVVNMMQSRTTTIHWHGISQRGTPYQDGVPMVTQCPIPHDTRYRYDFLADEEGTYFWHSHDGIQKVDGIQGSLIVRQPKQMDPNGAEYDEDLPAHLIFLTDWFHSDSDQHYPGLTNPEQGVYATYFLINGRGRYQDPVFGNRTNTPYTEYRVTFGRRYRFRVIGALCNHCYVRFGIEGHRLRLIATDGSSVRPVDVDYLEIASGERYDFVIEARRPVGSYWVVIRGMGDNCQRYSSVQQAILRYEGSNEVEPLTTEPDLIFDSLQVVLNPQNSTCSGRGVCVAQLETIENFNRRILNPEPDISFDMTFGYNHPTDEEEFRPNTYNPYTHPVPRPNSTLVVMWMNNIVYRSPPSPVISQRANIPTNVFCPLGPNGVPRCFPNRSSCSCFHLQRVPLGALVQFVLIDRSDTGGFNHPFHLHGYEFGVMTMGYSQGQLSEDFIRNRIMANFNSSRAPVFKDTIVVPSAGYAVIRFVADNPGYWLFHCHFLYHHVTGMSMVIQVGDSQDIPPVPRNFPRCGNYLPPESTVDVCQSTSFFDTILNWIQNGSRRIY